MAKKKAAKKETKEKGKQLDLIDVAPKNAKPILAVAREYVKHRDARMAIGVKEAECKHRVIELVKAAKLTPLKGGVIRFRCDSMEIELKPEGVKLKVKEA